ncbi:hypothetical protein GCM10010207_43800 [Streptomyces atratus]|nr:hypothetical protein GCM10010207_43800 [Streptomyces atratus]
MWENPLTSPPRNGEQVRLIVTASQRARPPVLPAVRPVGSPGQLLGEPDDCRERSGKEPCGQAFGQLLTVVVRPGGPAVVDELPEGVLVHGVDRAGRHRQRPAARKTTRLSGVRNAPVSGSPPMLTSGA